MANKYGFSDAFTSAKTAPFNDFNKKILKKTPCGARFTFDAYAIIAYPFLFLQLF